MGTLRLVHRMDRAEHVVELALEGLGARRTAEARFDLGLMAQDREDLRWYLEDYLQYPLDPAPLIARRVEDRLTALGQELFRRVFEANRDTVRLWNAVAEHLADTRLEIASDAEGTAGVPWEILRDPATDGVLALRAGAFVRTHPQAVGRAELSGREVGALRVLLVICRPRGPRDVPFRSVASHLVRLSRSARVAFQLDVLRPPTFAALTRVLGAAKAAGSPYHVVHFDGHGVYLDETTVAAATSGDVAGEFDPRMFSLVSPPRPGAHGFLVFEDGRPGPNQALVDGPALGKLLVDTDVPVLVLNACRSAHADLVTQPETVAAELDAHQRVRAYGSLAQEVMDAGAAGVVAMRYNVYVVTAAQFIGHVYAGLLEGRELGAAVTSARRQLAADPLRHVGAQPRPLQDWLVPLIYEAAPLALCAAAATPGLVIDLSQAEAGTERAGLEAALPSGPDAGFYGRDETLLALDRAFDTDQVVLLHAWAGAGKTATALEFARWYALTGAANAVLFSSFTHYSPLARLLDQVGNRFGPALASAGVQWAALEEAQRRDVVLRVLAQVPVLWVWDNVEPVAGFPVGAPSVWSAAEQNELAGFLRDIARSTRCKVLLTSRRDEQGWLGDLPRRMGLPPMPMLERLELAKAVAARQPSGRAWFVEVEDWRPLLDFTQGNPLVVTILVRQAVRDNRTARAELAEFVAKLRNGAARLADDPAQGRGSSLGASLDYGFSEAFTEAERAQLAVLALFQGFVDVGVLHMMGTPEISVQPVGALEGVGRAAGIALLDRAAEVGLLTALTGGYYAVHPAVPWYLQDLFERHYGPPASASALAALRSWTVAISAKGGHFHAQFADGHAEASGILGAEEANLLRARQIAIEHGWHDMVMGSMQGLRTLYEERGRVIEWQHLVNELVPALTDPADGGPVPGREEEWGLLTDYRIRLALQARAWATAHRLAEAQVALKRKRAADALTTPPEKLNEFQHTRILNLATALQMLGSVLSGQDDPGCVYPYLEAAELYRRIGARRDEGIIAVHLGNAYKDISGLRDLDEAERWYRRDLSLLEQHDTLGRATITTQLGALAYARFHEGQNADTPPEDRARHLNDAFAAYSKALELFPSSAFSELAVIHNMLGLLYDDIRDYNRALKHYQQSIQYEEQLGNHYGAGTARYNVTLALWHAERHHDALLYAHAALRDYEAVGPSAAAQVDRQRRLIADLERDLPDARD